MSTLDFGMTALSLPSVDNLLEVLLAAWSPACNMWHFLMSYAAQLYCIPHNGCVGTDFK